MPTVLRLFRNEVGLGKSAVLLDAYQEYRVDTVD